MQLGPTRFAVDSRNKNVQRPFVQSLIVRETEFAIKQQAEQTTIQELYSMLATDPARNNLICKDVLQALEDRRSPICSRSGASTWKDWLMSCVCTFRTLSCSMGQ